MKILFDANLSPALVTRLFAEYPGSSHVRDVSLRSAPDGQIWDYAKTHGLVIASKDTDFRERSFVEGFPPKVIWLDVGGHDRDPDELSNPALEPTPVGRVRVRRVPELGGILRERGAAERQTVDGRGESICLANTHQVGRWSA